MTFTTRMDFCSCCDVHVKNLKQHQRSAKHLKNVEPQVSKPQEHTLIQEQNEAFLQSLETDLMKEIEKINEACDVKPTLEELRKIRSHFFNKQNMM